MFLNELSAVSPIDGRYRKATQCLAQYFSESGLIQYRVKVEIEYLIALSHVSLRGSDFGMLMDKTVELRNWANSLTLEEIFTGSNYKSYKHKYYRLKKLKRPQTTT